MKKILILFGHPAFKRSTINAALRKAVESLEGITFHDLYASYPDFLIDVPHNSYSLRALCPIFIGVNTAANQVLNKFNFGDAQYGKSTTDHYTSDDEGCGAVSKNELETHTNKTK